MIGYLLAPLSVPVKKNGIISVPGVAGDGSRDLYHLIRSSLGIFRAKYDIPS